MGIGTDALGLVIAGMVIWIILPDPIPVIDEMILIPVVAILILKFGKDL